MKAFDNFIIFFGYFTILSFLLGIFGMICFYIGKRSNSNSKYYYKLGTIFIIQLLTAFLLLYLFHGIFNRKVKSELRSIDPKNVVLKINGKETNLQFNEKFFDDLRQVSNLHTNHSGPYKEIKIEIISLNKKCHISLFRDNQDPNMFWVFVTDYRTSKMNDIGQFRTKLLEIF